MILIFEIFIFIFNLFIIYNIFIFYLIYLLIYLLLVRILILSLIIHYTHLIKINLSLIFLKKSIKMKNIFLKIK